MSELNEIQTLTWTYTDESQAIYLWVGASGGSPYKCTNNQLKVSLIEPQLYVADGCQHGYPTSDLCGSLFANFTCPSLSWWAGAHWSNTAGAWVYCATYREYSCQLTDPDPVLVSITKNLNQ